MEQNRTSNNHLLSYLMHFKRYYTPYGVTGLLIGYLEAKNVATIMVVPKYTEDNYKASGALYPLPVGGISDSTITEKIKSDLNSQGFYEAFMARYMST